MTATKTAYSVLSINEAIPDALEREVALGGPQGSARVRLRRELGIESFGINAFHQTTAGESLVNEHDELGPGSNHHEELYIVVAGSATFTIDGETVEAPQGTALFVPDPASKRSAVAKEDGTTIVAVGGTPGQPWEMSAGEAQGDFFQLYKEKDYAGALAACRQALGTHPGNALVLYNVACMESLLGNKEEALKNLGPAVADWAPFKELASKDDDFESIRDDPRFQELVA